MSSTTVELEITDEESLRLVQEFVLIAIGCIAYLRDLLPEEAFNDDTFDAFYGLPTSGKKYNLRTLNIKRIRNNYSPEADLLVNWIKEDVFQLLQSKDLASLSIDIMTDARQADIKESHVFNFQHFSDPTLNGSLDGIRTPETMAKTLDHFRKEIHISLKKFIVDTQTLPNLPNTKIMAARLLLTKQKMSSTATKYFVSANISQKYPKFLVNNLNDLRLKGTPQLASIFHSLTAKQFLPSRSKSIINHRIDSVALLSQEPKIKLTRIDTNEEKHKQHLDEDSCSTPQRTHQYKVTKSSTSSMRPKSKEKLSRVSYIPEMVVKKNNPPIQEHLAHNCECGNSKSLAALATKSIKCQNCAKLCHKCCYFSEESTNDVDFQCLMCTLFKAGQEYSTTVDHEVKSKFHLRKAFRLLTLSTKTDDFPDYMSKLCTELVSTELNSTSEEEFIMMLKQLFLDKALLIYKNDNAKNKKPKRIVNDFSRGISICGFFTLGAKEASWRTILPNESLSVIIGFRAARIDKHKKAVKQKYYAPWRITNSKIANKKEMLDNNSQNSLDKVNLKYLQTLAHPDHVSSFQATQELPIQATQELPIQATQELPIQATQELPIQATQELPIQATQDLSLTQRNSQTDKDRILGDDSSEDSVFNLEFSSLSDNTTFPTIANQKH